MLIKLIFYLYNVLIYYHLQTFHYWFSMILFLGIINKESSMRDLTMCQTVSTIRVKWRNLKCLKKGCLWCLKGEIWKWRENSADDGPRGRAKLSKLCFKNIVLTKGQGESSRGSWKNWQEIVADVRAGCSSRSKIFITWRQLIMA